MPPQMSCNIIPRLTKEQHDILESHFQTQSKPSTNTKKGFAETLNVSLDKVNVSALMSSTGAHHFQAENCTELVSEPPREIKTGCKEAGGRLEPVCATGAKSAQRLQLRLRYVPIVRAARLLHDDAACARRSGFEYNALHSTRTGRADTDQLTICWQPSA